MKAILQQDNEIKLADIKQVCFHAGMDINNLTYADAIRVYKTPGRLAEVFGIRPQAVYQWHEKLPRGRRFELSVLLRGVLESTDPEQAALKAHIESLMGGEKSAA